MAENSKIEWTDHTFNPWIGCTKVSAACDHCYAEAATPTRVMRAAGRETWGPHAPRQRTSAANWKKPLQWNKQAQAEGRRFRVFCASLADVFDNHKSILPEWRADLWRLIFNTPHLDWLILTKRPQNIAKMLPDAWEALTPGKGWSNVWLGTTVENQTEADRRIPRLLATPAAVRFLSVEPMLGPVDLAASNALPIYWEGTEADGPLQITTLGKPIGTARRRGWVKHSGNMQPWIDWVICGGESGPGARPMHPDWARSLRDQCNAADVPFFFKQWGEHEADEIGPEGARSTRYPPGHVIYRKVGKKAAGRKLGGREWNEMPGVAHG